VVDSGADVLGKLNDESKTTTPEGDLSPVFCCWSADFPGVDSEAVV
jgi:hypothetical protein